MISHVALHTHFSVKTPKETLSTSFSSHVLAKLQLFCFFVLLSFFLQIWHCAAIEQLIVQRHRLTLQQHREELSAVALKMLHLCVTKTFTTLYESNILIVQFHNKNKNCWTKQPPPEAFSHVFFFLPNITLFPWQCEIILSMHVWCYSWDSWVVVRFRVGDIDQDEAQLSGMFRVHEASWRESKPSWFQHFISR